jgi:hypothetical protein
VGIPGACLPAESSPCQPQTEADSPCFLLTAHHIATIITMSDDMNVCTYACMYTCPYSPEPECLNPAVQIYDIETSYFTSEYTSFGTVLKGFEGAFGRGYLPAHGWAARCILPC